MLSHEFLPQGMCSNSTRMSPCTDYSRGLWTGTAWVQATESLEEVAALMATRRKLCE